MASRERRRAREPGESQRFLRLELWRDRWHAGHEPPLGVPERCGVLGGTRERPDLDTSSGCASPLLPGTCLSGVFWTHAATPIGDTEPFVTTLLRSRHTVGLHGPNLANHFFSLAPDEVYSFHRSGGGLRPIDAAGPLFPVSERAGSLLGGGIALHWHHAGVF